MGIDIRAIGRTGTPFVREWTSDESLLYALAVGAGRQSHDGFELEFTTESSEGVDHAVLPSFAAYLAIPERTLLPSVGADWTRSVHGLQRLELFRPLPTASSVVITPRVSSIEDKGSGALVTYETDAVFAETDEPAFHAEIGVFFLGQGGFAGPTDRERPAVSRPVVSAELSSTIATRPEQALLYRLTGDRNPLHSDPTVARRLGFRRPILHGMCTYGMVGRELLHLLCESRPERFRSMSARFAAPVYPGSRVTLDVQLTTPGCATFAARCGDTTVMSDGIVTFTGPAGPQR